MKAIKTSKHVKLAHLTSNDLQTLCGMEINSRCIFTKDLETKICEKCANAAERATYAESEAKAEDANNQPIEDWYVPSSDEEIFAPVPAKVETEFKLLGSEWSDKKDLYTYRVIETGSNGAVRLEQTNCKVSYKRWTTEAALAKYYKRA